MPHLRDNHTTNKIKMTKKSTQTAVATTYQAEPTPTNLIQMGIEKNMGIDQLDKLISLQERWMASRAREEYNKAFAMFQKNAPDLQKNRKVAYESKGDRGGNVNYRYQDLANIAKVIRGPLADCGLSYNWEQEDKDNEILVTCVIRHVAGHVERSMPLRAALDNSGGKTGIHAKASTITYLRRYTLTGMLGLSSADPDDDGTKAVKASKEKDGLPFIGPDQYKATMKKVVSGETTVAKVKEYFSLTPDQESALNIATPEAAKQ